MQGLNESRKRKIEHPQEEAKMPSLPPQDDVVDVSEPQEEAKMPSLYLLRMM